MSPTMAAHTPPQQPKSPDPFLAVIESHLDRCLDERDLPANLVEACRYAVLGGGKRLRPLLTVLCCDCVGGDWRSALPAGAATEFIHAFSLVHDDLPAMDNDELRRGQPTVWAKYGEAMAILAGDALQSLAFELLCDDRYPPPLSSALIRELSFATTRMIAGQVYDTLGGLAEGSEPRELVETIHRNKTGALIRASCRMGAMCGGANEAAIRAITAFGESVGLMFQIVDDVLDVTQSAEHLGKKSGKDVVAGKMTFPGVTGLEFCTREIERLHQQATHALRPFGERSRTLVDVADYLAIRTR